MDLRHLGYYPVPLSFPPAPSAPFKRVVLAKPKWVGDELVRDYAEVPWTEEELTEGWKKLRTTRDLRLRNTDWSQIVSDISEEHRAAYAAYRQALRDLPSNTVDPYQANWPVLNLEGVS